MPFPARLSRHMALYDLPMKMSIFLKHSLLVLSVLVLSLSVVIANSFEESALPLKFSELRSAPRIFEPPDEFKASEEAEKVPEGVHAVCFEGLPYKGQPTRVFGFYGIPKDAGMENKVPGIVLVHGGGGTAFAEWVKLWVDRGYAAIAFDHNGSMPVGSYSKWVPLPKGAGPRMASLSDIGRPLADHWMTHAIADTILAHSLLASFSGVDAERIGITGISWGAIITGNVVSIDTRLKFAALVYGCGFLAENDDDGSRYLAPEKAWKEDVERLTAWGKLWDPKNRLPVADLPILWVNGTNDHAFTMHSWQRSYRLPLGPRWLSLKVRMVHAHGGPGENPREILVFADSVVRNGKPLLTVGAPRREENSLFVEYSPAAMVKEAVLNYTLDGGRWQDRKWEGLPINLPETADGRETAVLKVTLPEGATAWYFNFKDERNLLVSSEHDEL